MISISHPELVPFSSETPHRLHHIVSACPPVQPICDQNTLNNNSANALGKGYSNTHPVHGVDGALVTNSDKTVSPADSENSRRKKMMRARHMASTL